MAITRENLHSFGINVVVELAMQLLEDREGQDAYIKQLEDNRDKHWDDIDSAEKKIVELEKVIENLKQNSKNPRTPINTENSKSYCCYIIPNVTINKIGAVKILRAKLGCGIKEGKEFIEGKHNIVILPELAYNLDLELNKVGYCLISY